MNLSLCCISNILAEQGIKFRTLTYKKFSSCSREEGFNKITEISLHNLDITFKTIKHCVEMGFSGYRMSSNIFPLLTHPDIKIKMYDLPQWEIIKDKFNQIAIYIKEKKLRISAHPSEYITLTSENINSVNNSISDLELHGEIFDRLDLPLNHVSPLNIHIRKDGDIETLYCSFIKNYEKLSNSVKSRLVLENNDNVKGTWSIKKLVNIFHKRNNIPITFDYLHHYFLHDNLSEEEAFHLAFKTWNVTPIFHYSESRDGTKAHADLPTKIPNIYNKNILLDVELKGKDYALLKMQNLYSFV